MKTPTANHVVYTWPTYLLFFIFANVSQLLNCYIFYNFMVFSKCNQLLMDKLVTERAVENPNISKSEYFEPYEKAASKALPLKFILCRFCLFCLKFLFLGLLYFEFKAFHFLNFFSSVFFLYVKFFWGGLLSLRFFYDTLQSILSAHFSDANT